MKLKCRINEKEYDIVQGAAFSEEYNETLDSGTIKIAHEEMIDMKPYDDVYVWDASYDFEGFRNTKEVKKNISISVDYDNVYGGKETFELQGDIKNYIYYFYLNESTMSAYKQEEALKDKIFVFKGTSSPSSGGGGNVGGSLISHEHKYKMTYNSVNDSFFMYPLENNDIPSFTITKKRNYYTGEGFSKYNYLYYSEGLYEKAIDEFGTDTVLSYSIFHKTVNDKVVSLYIEEKEDFKNIQNQDINLKFYIGSNDDIIPYKISYKEKEKMVLSPNIVYTEDTPISAYNYLTFNLIYDGEKYACYMGNSLFSDISLEQFSINNQDLKNIVNLNLEDFEKEKITYIRVKEQSLIPFKENIVKNYELIHSGSINFSASTENIPAVYYAYQYDYLIRYIEQNDSFEFYKKDNEQDKIILNKQDTYYEGEISIPQNYNNGAFDLTISTKEEIIRDSFIPVSYEYINHDFSMEITLDDDLEKIYSIISEQSVEKVEYNLELRYSILGSNVWQTYRLLYDNVKEQFYLSPKSEDNSSAILNFDIYLHKQDGVYKGTAYNNIIDSVVLSNNGYVIYYKEFKKYREYFYKHFLIDSFSETMINVQDLVLRKGVANYKPIYEYTIQLFSETKGLEVVQLPNISITEPLNLEKKISVWEYLNKFVDMYSPKFKQVSNNQKKTWEYTQKYHVDSDLKPIFENVYSPDFSLNNPNLRDVLAKFMITKDMIPYVEDDIIKAMDITERKSEFKHPEDYKNINYISSNMTSSNYCDNLKKTYSDALSKDSTTKIIDYIGFRNSDNSLMTIGNMRLETRFPIYKINKVYMCYYKAVKINNRVDSSKSRKMAFLCKQDITPLVLLNTERNALKEDWNNLDTNGTIDTQGELALKYNIKKTEDLAKYKMTTVGYDIGSKHITGWGTKYTYPIENTFWDVTKTYIENIFKIVDLLNPYGIYGYDYFEGQIDTKNEDVIFNDTTSSQLNVIVSPDSLQIVKQYDEEGNDITPVHEFINNDAIKLKSLMFQVDYQAFYNGTTIHSKDIGRDNITINDNPSSSLTLLEQDGLYTKEKANRFGNKGLTINARYDNVSEMKELGSVFKVKEDDDIIIYHREYQIWDNYVQTTYYGMHDYVLKNYYTSVYAKHRTWNLMPYNESVRRSENRKAFILLSKNNSYYEKIEEEFSSINLESFLSFFKNNNLLGYENWEDNSKLNYGIITHKGSYYISDINAFINGYSLVANITMFDNNSMGTYISVPRPTFNSDGKNFLSSFLLKIADLLKIEKEIVNAMLSSNVKDDYTGSKQDWHMIVDDNNTGFIKELGFYIGHQNGKFLNEEFFKTDDSNSIINKNFNNIFQFPLIKDTSKLSLSNKIGKVHEINKDNKEIIDMTYQVEPITNDKDVLFSSWLMRLSDLLFNYKKIGEYKETRQEEKVEESVTITGSEYHYLHAEKKGEVTLLQHRSIPIISLIFPKGTFDDIKNNLKAGTSVNPTRIHFNTPGVLYTYIGDHKIDIYSFLVSSIKGLDETGDRKTIRIKGSQLIVRGKKNFLGNVVRDSYEKEAELKLIEIKNSENFYVPEDTVMFSTSYLETSEKMPLEENEKTMFNFKGTQYEVGNCVAGAGYPSIEKDISMNNSIWKPLGIYGDKSVVTKQYYQNNFIVVSDKNMKKTIVYDECKLEELNYVEGINPEDVMMMVKNENEVPYLQIDIRNLENRESIKSVQHWYYNEEDKSCHFVFGVNLNSEEQQQGIIKIYTSMLSLRDTRVYDENHKQIGKISNYKDSNKVYGYNQYYE